MSENWVMIKKNVISIFQYLNSSAARFPDVLNTYKTMFSTPSWWQWRKSKSCPVYKPVVFDNEILLLASQPVYLPPDLKLINKSYPLSSKVIFQHSKKFINCSAWLLKNSSAFFYFFRVRHTFLMTFQGGGQKISYA